MTAKTLFMEEYFKHWHEDIEKAGELLGNQRYYLECWLVLSCYVGAFASMRFPTLQDSAAYVKAVLEYSGKREFYEQIDLLFLCQWPRSKLREHGTYKMLKNHEEIVKVLNKLYGSEEDIKAEIRYLSPSKLISDLVAAAIPNFDEKNFRDGLPLFSLAEQLYRYVRCDAVHNAKFPFVDKATTADGNTVYRDNHAITGQVLLETTLGVLSNLRDECLTNHKWPHEL